MREPNFRRYIEMTRGPNFREIKISRPGETDAIYRRFHRAILGAESAFG